VKYIDQFNKSLTRELIDALIGKEEIYREVCDVSEADPKKVRELVDTILDQDIPQELVTNYVNGNLTENKKIVKEYLEPHTLSNQFCSGCPAQCCMMSDPIAVTWPDVQRLAKGLKTNNKKIVKEYLEPHTLSNVPHLQYKIKRTKPCQWLNERTKRCTIYELRPQICRSYPIIPNREHPEELKLDAPIYCKVTASMIKQDILNRLI
jgi:Fe-S-cluster containining protein